MEQQFEHKGLEADIERLSKEVSEQVSRPEVKRGEVSHRDVVREAVRPLIYPQNEPQQKEEGGFLPDYAKDFPPESKLKVEQLIDLAIHKGIERAADEARKAGDPAVIDLFHDAITTKLLEEFQRMGILKK
ncbi:MAG: hypothetical protein HY456_01260 [Parcubacteria group bacterium]|nr:hypothetical protein [Parcubacteria group bacterium]